MAADIRQWEYISYCLSQLAFTEKGMKKLMESFKTYEHVLSEDSVMDHFKSIINKVWIICSYCFLSFISGKIYFRFAHINLKQSKKFAKPELKLCIEEFEDKLNKFHLEKKEQEVTARNARIHQQKIDSMEDYVVTRNAGEANIESDIDEG